jgi:hypothetical protein
LVGLLSLEVQRRGELKHRRRELQIGSTHGRRGKKSYEESEMVMWQFKKNRDGQFLATRLEYQLFYKVLYFGE